MNNLPIGVLDSGIGGASILKEVIKIIPNEKYVYLADRKNMPYGNKSKRRILKIVEENTRFLINKHRIKMLIIACNTASSVCSKSLRKQFNIPIICIEPPIKPAIECGYKKILILATKRTLKSNKTIKRNIKLVKQKNKSFNKIDKITIKKLAIKNLASEIDKNFNNFNSLQKFLDEKLNQYKNFDAVITGCTHYNFVKEQIQNAMPDTKIISCEVPAAKRAKFILELENLKIDLELKPKNIIILTKPNLRLKRFLENYLTKHF